jgi:hypothetical protein
MDTAPNAFIFMKVGNHAGETFDSILRRKNEEYRKAGRIFWGYGGSACHPLKQVRPFVEVWEKQNGSIYVLMQEIDSRAQPDLLPAKEYSWDTVNWEPLPEGINVLGSRYALVLDEIKPTDFEIDPQEYVIGIGAKQGKVAGEYMQGHIDKACLVRAESPAPNNAKVRRRKIKYAAKLLPPYGVLVRS